MTHGELANKLVDFIVKTIVACDIAPETMKFFDEHILNVARLNSLETDVEIKRNYDADIRFCNGLRDALANALEAKNPQANGD